MILQHIDDLFLLPPTPVAMPRLYWESDDNRLADPIILIEPSSFEFDRVSKAILGADPNVYDMDIVPQMYHRSALVCPHRRLILLTGELRRADDDHSAYLGNSIEKWNADEIMQKTKYVHFSNCPVPQPWAVTSKGILEQDATRCMENPSGMHNDCQHQRDIWIGFYEDYAFRRKMVCEIDDGYLEKWGSTSDAFQAPF